MLHFRDSLHCEMQFHDIFHVALQAHNGHMCLLQIYPDENGEPSDRLLGYFTDGESANLKALRMLEERYHFLVNIWC